jgi:hypothetical protein
MKNVQSNRGHELSNGETRRLSHSESDLLSPNSPNHYSITPDCLKFSKSMSSRRLRHLTCLQTIYIFWRGSVHFAQKYWHPVRDHKKSTLLRNPNGNRTVFYQFKNGENMALTKTSTEKTSNGMNCIGRQLLLQLIFAGTVHRSQGMTLQRAVIDCRVEF